MNTRVLIFSSSYGSGHIRAAEAVMEELLRQDSMAEIIHTDWAVLISKKLNDMIKHTYIGIIKYAPKLWGRIYYDTAGLSSDSALQRFLNRLGETVFLDYINSVNPDIIVCTYPIIAGILARLRLKKILDIPVATVVTDYAVHTQWVHPGMDLYVVGCDEIYQGFVSRGINPGSIQTTGIPVSNKFEIKLEPSRIIRELGLSPQRSTILLMGGAYGVLNDFKEICKLIADLPVPCQVIVVCGRNKRLYNSLDEIIHHTCNPIVRFGFVRNMEELMTAADLIITKAGGLIVSEALTKRLPLVIFKPIPGQEDENTNYLCRIGAGVAAHNMVDLNRIIHELLKRPEELEKMRQAAALAVPGQAAERAVASMLKMIFSGESSLKMG